MKEAKQQKIADAKAKVFAKVDAEIKALAEVEAEVQWLQADAEAQAAEEGVKRGSGGDLKEVRRGSEGGQEAEMLEAEEKVDAMKVTADAKP